MAHKKGAGSSRNGRDSAGQRLGVKRYAGERVTAGSIIVRQHGTKFHPGTGVALGRDYTVYATIDGIVKFEPMRDNRRRICVYPIVAAAAETAAEPAAENAG